MSPSSTPIRSPGGRAASAHSSSDVLPAPGALIRLTTVTSWRSKSSRLARAIVLLASSASSTIFTFVLCMSGLPVDLLGHLNVVDLELAAGDHGDVGRRADRAAEGRELRLPLVVAGLTAEPGVDLLELESRAVADRVAGDDLPVEAQRIGHDLAHRPDPHRDDGDGA